MTDLINAMEEWDDESEGVSDMLCVRNSSRSNCLLNVTNNGAVDSKTVEIWTPDVIQRVASLLFIMVLTLLGNTIIIIVLTCSRYGKRNSRVNIFIINLSVGDLMVCAVTMTTEIIFVAFGEWLLGNAACKILTYLQIVTLASTTFILTSMGFDRYMAICKPLKFRSSNTRARRMIIISWLLACIFALPQLFIFVQTIDEVRPDGTNKYGCRSQGYSAMWQRKVYFTFLTTYILVVPAILISYCYVNVALVVWKQGKLVAGTNTCSLRKSIVNNSAIPRAKIKTVKMTLSIIVSFIACWTPYFVTTLIKIYSNYSYKIPASVMAFSETCALLQSALNPILYGFFNIQITRGLMEVFCPNRIHKKEHHQQMYKRGVSDCLSVSGSEPKSVSKGHIKLREHNSSDSSGSFDRSRTHGCIIAEANTNGFKLRVRFLSKETLYVHDRVSYCRPKENPDEQLTCETVM